MDFQKFVILVKTFSSNLGMRYFIQIEDGKITVQFLDVPGSCEYNKIVIDFVKCIDVFPSLLLSYSFNDDIMFFEILPNFSEDN